MKKWTRNNFTTLLALLIVALTYMAARLPDLEVSKKKELAGAFKFESRLIELGEQEYASIRTVHPSYQLIDAWISSVGSAAMFTDLSKSGRYEDLILVEPRTDKVYHIDRNQSVVRDFSAKELPYDDSKMAPMGVLSHDFDENGSMDILVYYWGRTPIVFYQGENGYTERELAEPYQNWFSNAATLADVNGDGHADIIVGNYFPDHAAILDETNNEVQSMQHSMSRADNGARNRLFLWDSKSKNGFTENKEWLEGLGTLQDWTLAIAAADINNDLLPELYVSNDFGPDKLLVNTSSNGKVQFKLAKGNRKFTDMSSCVLGRDSFKGMGAEFSDLNRDGWLDIYVSNIADEYALEESHFVYIHTGKDEQLSEEVAPYVNRSEQLGLSRSSWGWDCKFADFNNDGIKEAIQATGFVKGTTNRWPELHEIAMGNDELLAKTSLWHRLNAGDDLSGKDHNPFFVQSGGYFYDLAPQLDIHFPQVSRGLAISDYDHDGDLDFVSSNQWEPSRFYENRLPDSTVNQFLGLNIQQSFDENETSVNKNVASYPAIGCQVRVMSVDGKSLKTDQQMVGFVDGGNGHSGVNSKEVYFGLGDLRENSRILIELKWRNRNGVPLVDQLDLTPGWHQITLKN